MEKQNQNSSNEQCEFRNPHLNKLSSDTLYHLGLSTADQDFQKLFGDVRFVCMGGSAHRMKNFAQYVAQKLNIENAANDITGHAHRYSMFKVGPILSVSHGIGAPSLSVVLDELIKLLSYAKCKDVIVFRLGTCGGIGVEPGTVVITNKAVDGLLRPCYEQYVLGKIVTREALIDQKLVNEVKAIAETIPDFKVVIGGTMSSADFYEGQGRLDGPFCNYGEAEKYEFLQRLYNEGIRNIEMEAVSLAAKCHAAGLKCVIMNVALVNRLKGDQVCIPPKLYVSYETKPQELAISFIKYKLQHSSK